MRLTITTTGLSVVADARPQVRTWRQSHAAPGWRGGQWTDDQWSLAWLADAHVLGDWGIEPELEEPALSDWRTHYVDADRTLTPRDYQSLLVMAIVATGTAYEYEDPDGIHVMPPPTAIRRAGPRNRPVSYEWQLPGWERIIRPAEVVTVHYLSTTPQQQLGVDLYDAIADVARERRRFLPAVIQLARLTSIMRLFHRRSGGASYLGAPEEADEIEEPIEVDFDRSGITEIAAGDEIISPTVSAGPIRVAEVERATGGAVGRPFGISRLAASRDYSDANYSSAKLAEITDRQAWQRYQRVVLRATQPLYARWPGVAEYPLLPKTPVWRFPAMPPVDPHRESAVDRQQIADGVVSRQMVMRRYGRDPERVMAEIEEWNARFGSASGRVGA